jgi:hypothetical protein
MIRPRLDSFTLDMTTAQLVMNFSETVHVLTLDCTQLTLQLSSDTTTAYNLTGCVKASTEPSYLVTLTLLHADMNELKTNLIGQTKASTWLTFTNATWVDQFTRPVMALRNGVNALQATSQTVDSKAPEVTSYNLDMTLGQLTLFFSESVLSSSLVPEGLTFHSTHAGGRNFTLTSNTNVIVSGGNTDSLVLQLGTTDLNAIKQRYPLAVSNTTTFLSFALDSLTDIAATPNGIVYLNCTGP